MKFKCAITGLLAAILATCIFTSYNLINETKKQTEYQRIQALASIATAGGTMEKLTIPELGNEDLTGPADFLKMYWEAKDLINAIE